MERTRRAMRAEGCPGRLGAYWQTCKKQFLEQHSALPVHVVPAAAPHASVPAAAPLSVAAVPVSAGPSSAPVSLSEASGTPSLSGVLGLSGEPLIEGPLGGWAVGVGVQANATHSKAAAIAIVNSDARVGIIRSLMACQSTGRTACRAKKCS